MPGMHFKGAAKKAKTLGGSKSPKLGSSKGLTGVQMKTPLAKSLSKR